MNYIIFFILFIFLIILILTKNNYNESFSMFNPLSNCFKNIDIENIVEKTMKEKKKVCMNYTNFKDVLKCMNPFYPIAY